MILEKRILYDVSMRDCNTIIYIVTNLESCYDRQLGHIVSIVKELIRIDRNGVKLITKVLPVLQHYVYTGFGISKMYYRDVKNIMGRTDQGNCFLGDNSRDTSCFIIRRLEVEELGAMIRALISRKTVQQAALAFVDDKNLYSNKLKCNERIQ